MSFIAAVDFIAHNMALLSPPQEWELTLMEAKELKPIKQLYQVLHFEFIPNEKNIIPTFCKRPTFCPR
jgi:hypothetical protein